MPLSFLRNSLRRVPNTSKLKKTSQFRLNALTRQTSRHVLQQRRNFYFSVPFVVVPGLIAFVSITVYQVYKKQQRDEIDALENSNRIQWRAKEIIYYGKKYAKRDDSNEVYDIQSYNNAIKAQNGEHITPILVGYWDRDEDGKQCIRMVGGEDVEAAGVGEKK